MIVAAWFIFVALVILVGFALLVATFINWFKQARIKSKSEAARVKAFEA